MSFSDQPQFLSSCPACGGVLDVTAFEPFSKVVCPNCGESVRVRRKFDHFVIAKQIGEGGMSRVFESADETLGRRVALKILNRHFSRDSVRMAQFEREAQLTAAVAHPNVVKLYSVGRDQGNFYIAMELVGSGSLEQRMHSQERLPEKEALGVGRAVAEGLRAAYREGLIHRDVKPANILFTEEGLPKIVDFGLALFHERDVDNSGEIWATPYYVAPEKVCHDREDFRSDMFSLGATLYHALTGRPPHQANTNSVAELKVIKSRTVRLENSGFKFAPRTRELVNRLLALKPEDRFQSYDALVAAFRDAEILLEYSLAGIRSSRKKILYTALAAAAGITILALIIRPPSKRELPTVDVNSQVTVASAPDLAETLASGRESVTEVFLKARNTLIEGKFAEARKMFNVLVKSEVTKQPTRNWARFNAAICAIVAEQREPALKYFRDIKREADEDSLVGGADVKKFFSDLSAIMRQELGFNVRSKEAHYQTDNEEALTYLVHGLAQWHFGDPVAALEWFEIFSKCEPGKGYEWVGSYKKLAAPYLEDSKIARELPSLRQQNFASFQDAEKNLGRVKHLLTEVKTSGSLHDGLAGQLSLVQKEIMRIKRDGQQKQEAKLKEIRQRDLTQFSELVSHLPSLVRGYDFSRVMEILKETHFETPEVQTALESKRYFWGKAQDFMEQLISDVKYQGYSGSIPRRIGSPLQGKIAKLDIANITVALQHGEVAFPTEMIAPDMLVAMAQKYCQGVSDSTDYYRRQEMIAIFAKTVGLDQMAQAVAGQLMEENRAFRQLWTNVEQGGS